MWLLKTLLLPHQPVSVLCLNFGNYRFRKVHWQVKHQLELEPELARVWANARGSISRGNITGRTQARVVQSTSVLWCSVARCRAPAPTVSHQLDRRTHYIPILPPHHTMVHHTMHHGAPCSAPWCTMLCTMVHHALHHGAPYSAPWCTTPPHTVHHYIPIPLQSPVLATHTVLLPSATSSFPESPRLLGCLKLPAI